MSASLIVKHQTQASEALQPAYDELAAALPEEEAVWTDETPTTEQNQNAWIWAVVAETFTVGCDRTSAPSHGSLGGLSGMKSLQFRGLGASKIWKQQGVHTNQYSVIPRISGLTPCMSRKPLKTGVRGAATTARNSGHTLYGLYRPPDEGGFGY